MTAPARKPGRPSLLTRAGHAAPSLPHPRTLTALLEVQAAAVEEHAATLLRLAASLRAMAAALDRPAPVALDGYVSLSEAAQLTRLGTRTLAGWVASGYLPVLRNERGDAYHPIRIRRADLDRLTHEEARAAGIGSGQEGPVL